VKLKLSTNHSQVAGLFLKCEAKNLPNNYVYLKFMYFSALRNVIYWHDLCKNHCEAKHTNEGSTMTSNRVIPSRRLILSAKNLYSFQQDQKEILENSNKNENIDIELSLNEDNENYILGYN
jgi:hypothetical protein